MPRYEVFIDTTLTFTTDSTFQVEAANEDEARRIALDEAGEMTLSDLDSGDWDHRVIDVSEVDDATA